MFSWRSGQIILHRIETSRLEEDEDVRHQMTPTYSGNNLICVQCPKASITDSHSPFLWVCYQWLRTWEGLAPKVIFPIQDLISPPWPVTLSLNTCHPHFPSLLLPGHHFICVFNDLTDVKPCLGLTRTDIAWMSLPRSGSFTRWGNRPLMSFSCALVEVSGFPFPDGRSFTRVKRLQSSCEGFPNTVLSFTFWLKSVL